MERKTLSDEPYYGPMTAPPDSSHGAVGALAAALERVGDRWSLLIVEALLGGPQRFGELRDAIPAIAPNILTERLRRLEREAIVRASPYQRRPPRMQYELTSDGQDLASVLRLLADWGARGHAATDVDTARHDVCGTPLETRWFCPTCERQVEDREAPETRLL